MKERAHSIYHATTNKHFLHEHVWNVLKNELKWIGINRCYISSKITKNTESGTYTSSSNVDLNTPVDLTTGGDNEDEESHCIGQKAAKAKAKGKRKNNEKPLMKMEKLEFFWRTCTNKITEIFKQYQN